MKIKRHPCVCSSPTRLASVAAVAVAASASASSGSNRYSLGPTDDDLRSTATSRFRLPRSLTVSNAAELSMLAVQVLRRGRSEGQQREQPDEHGGGPATC